MSALFHAVRGRGAVATVILERSLALLLWDGKPMPNVSLEFIPEAGGRPSVGRTDEDGRYRAYYTHDQPGAELGKHHVRFQVFASQGAVSEEDELTPPSQQEGGGSSVAKGRTLSQISLT